MNVGSTGSTNPHLNIGGAQPATTPKSDAVESPQAQLLRRLMEAQRKEAEAQSNRSEGVGQLLDIRV
ncbi:MAG: hypothetical protein HZC36_09325 [Armatimonadetes bacterium]|nr:hypothetical protein [Armatimonadota bacterium]